jgi:hypothetical protein
MFIVSNTVHYIQSRGLEAPTGAPIAMPKKSSQLMTPPSAGPRTPVIKPLDPLPGTPSASTFIPPAASQPAQPQTPVKLTSALMDKIEPHTNEIISRLRIQEPLDQVAQDIASKAGVKPEEVKFYVSELARVAKKKRETQQK